VPQWTQRSPKRISLSGVPVLTGEFESGGTRAPGFAFVLEAILGKGKGRTRLGLPSLPLAVPSFLYLCFLLSDSLSALLYVHIHRPHLLCSFFINRKGSYQEGGKKDKRSSFKPAAICCMKHMTSRNLFRPLKSILDLCSISYICQRWKPS